MPYRIRPFHIPENVLNKALDFSSSDVLLDIWAKENKNGGRREFDWYREIRRNGEIITEKINLH